MIKKVNHIAVVVEDLEAAKSFWVDALGSWSGKTACPKSP
jgi:extradiol dioxygenase family protein